MHYCPFQQLSIILLMFNFDYIKALIMLVPVKLRKPKTLAWITVLSSLIVSLKEQTVLFRSNTLYNLNHNSQVASIEHLLNDIFNSGNPGIFITDPFFKPQTYLYNKREARPALYLKNASEASDPNYLHNRSTFYPSVNFIVWVPDFVVFDESRMRGLINNVKLAGKNYEIRVFSTHYFLEWSDKTCVQTGHSFEIRWLSRVCNVVYSGFEIEWSDRVCVRAEPGGIFEIKWTDRACVQIDGTITYEIKWADRVCVQADVTQYYEVKWSDQVCVQYDNPDTKYEIKWSDQVCVQELVKYEIIWLSPECESIYSESI
jgi:hypothetical protein